MWDAAGRLVAQSRQLARVGRGRLRVQASDSAVSAVSEELAVSEGPVVSA